MLFRQSLAHTLEPSHLVGVVVGEGESGFPGPRTRQAGCGDESGDNLRNALIAQLVPQGWVYQTNLHLMSLLKMLERFLCMAHLVCTVPVLNGLLCSRQILSVRSLPTAVACEATSNRCRA